MTTTTTTKTTTTIAIAIRKTKINYVVTINNMLPTNNNSNNGKISIHLILSIYAIFCFRPKNFCVVLVCLREVHLLTEYEADRRSANNAIDCVTNILSENQ